MPANASNAPHEIDDVDSLNDQHNNSKESATSSTDAHTPPPYEPPTPVPSAATLNDRLSAPNMHNALPVRIKAEELKLGEFGLEIPLQKFNDIVLISPSMTLDDFQRAFAKKIRAHPVQLVKPHARPPQDGDRTFMSVHASRKSRGLFFDKKESVQVNGENWPDVVSALFEVEFQYLTIKYFVEPASKATRSGISFSGLRGLIEVERGG